MLTVVFHHPCVDGYSDIGSIPYARTHDGAWAVEIGGVWIGGFPTEDDAKLIAKQIGIECDNLRDSMMCS